MRSLPKDLHIVEGDLPAFRSQLIPGHQIVGEVVEGATADLAIGTRVGVFWMGGVDSDCWYCHHGMENLCDKPTFAGYTVDGGYAEYVLARMDFVFPLPPGLDDIHVAPLLCAGIIGFAACALRVSNLASKLGFLVYAHLHPCHGRSVRRGSPATEKRIRALTLIGPQNYFGFGFGLDTRYTPCGKPAAGPGGSGNADRYA